MANETSADARSMARLAGLLADSTRATFCLALLDGRAWTAGELARLAGVAPSTASAHLTHLVGGGLLTEERQGRHRYVRLVDPGVAELIEDLAAYAPRVVVPPRSLRAANATAALAWARTCYDHLAGRVGVRLVDAMTDRGLLETGWALSDRGVRWFADLGIDVAALRSPRRPLVRHCLDWTERRPHLAGTAGAALCRHFFDRGWVTRTGGQRRAVRVTEFGRDALHDLLGIPPADLTPPARDTGSGGRA